MGGLTRRATAHGVGSSMSGETRELAELMRSDAGGILRAGGVACDKPEQHRGAAGTPGALDEEFLHVSVAQGEAEIKPDRVLNDLGWKAMAAIRKLRHGSH
jgi:hypothetical protein